MARCAPYHAGELGRRRGAHRAAARRVVVHLPAPADRAGRPQRRTRHRDPACHRLGGGRCAGAATRAVRDQRAPPRRARRDHRECPHNARRRPAQHPRLPRRHRPSRLRVAGHERAGPRPRGRNRRRRLHPRNGDRCPARTHHLGGSPPRDGATRSQRRGGQARRRGHAGGPRSRRARRPRAFRIPREHEPRDPDPDECRARVRGADPRYRAVDGAAPRAGAGAVLVRGAAHDSERHPRLLEDRGRPSGARGDSVRCLEGRPRHSEPAGGSRAGKASRAAR